MACMKRPFNTEREALANQHRINARVGAGPTRQVAYPCPDCSENMGPETWHLRTERPIEGKIAKVVKLKTGRKRRPSARPWEDEDTEGNVGSMTERCTYDTPHVEKVELSPIHILGPGTYWRAAKPGKVYLVGHGNHFYTEAEANEYAFGDKP